MKTIWFTSDHHFGHANIIKYSSRPFKTASEMDETMIRRWNERVKPGDLVYHLGDVGMCPPEQLTQILGRLHGDICLIRGNHEYAALQNKDRFVWIKDLFELKVDDADFRGGTQLLVLCHYAMRVWNASHHGTFHLYGHSHGSLPDDPDSRSFDIGVDCHNFYPLSYPEVKDIMMKKNWKPPFGDRN